MAGNSCDSLSSSTADDSTALAGMQHAPGGGEFGERVSAQDIRSESPAGEEQTGFENPAEENNVTSPGPGQEFSSENSEDETGLKNVPEVNTLETAPCGESALEAPPLPREGSMLEATGGNTTLEAPCGESTPRGETMLREALRGETMLGAPRAESIPRGETMLEALRGETMLGAPRGGTALEAPQGESIPRGGSTREAPRGGTALEAPQGESIPRGGSTREAPRGETALKALHGESTLEKLGAEISLKNRGKKVVEEAGQDLDAETSLKHRGEKVIEELGQEPGKASNRRGKLQASGQARGGGCGGKPRCVSELAGELGTEKNQVGDGPTSLTSTTHENGLSECDTDVHVTPSKTSNRHVGGSSSSSDEAEADAPARSPPAIQPPADQEDEDAGAEEEPPRVVDLRDLRNPIEVGEWSKSDFDLILNLCPPLELPEDNHVI